MVSFSPEKVRHTAPFFFFEEVTSTNDVAAQKGKEGAPNLTAVMANKQSKGRGRLGRVWVTYERDIALSTLIRGEVKNLPLLVVVALYKAVVELLGEKAENKVAIKWPNDLLLEGKKLAGVLIEAYPSAEGQFYVVGIGLNLSPQQKNTDFSTDRGYLNMVDVSLPPREEVASVILNALEQTLIQCQTKAGYIHMLEAYQENCITLGQQVIWRDGGKEITGKAVGFNEQGHLILKTQEAYHTCHVGDVVTLKEI